MPDETELRAALAALARRAPDAGAIAETVTRRYARRRRGALAGIAAGLAVVTASAPLLGGPSDLGSDWSRPTIAFASAQLRQDAEQMGGQPADPPPAVAPAPPPGFTVAEVSLAPEGETVRLVPTVSRQSSGRGPVSVARFAPAGFDPAAVRHGTPVRVHGRPGRYVAEPRGPRERLLTGAPVLAWEYERGVWALVRAEDGTRDGPGVRAGLLAVAVMVRIEQPRPIRLPLRLVRLPEGTWFAGVRATYPVGFEPAAHARLVPHVLITLARHGGTPIEISALSPGGGVAQQRQPSGPRGAELSRLLGPAGPVVTVRASGPGDPVDLEPIADAIRPAPSLDDPTTWFDLATAIPTP